MPFSLRVLIIILLTFLIIFVDMCSYHYYDNQYEKLEKKDSVKTKVV
jgi:hypothetical protein